MESQTFSNIYVPTDEEAVKLKTLYEARTWEI